tara:strand:+ start:368 stop:994 length:627 start_codon:yes stop_codon:yes gene_type:complete
MKSIKQFLLLFSAIALFSSCTETKTKETSLSKIIKAQEEVLYSFDETRTKVFWAGYKTEDKLKVIGQFKELTTDRSDQQFSSIEELVNGINFSINSASSISGDEIRDLSLNDYFFKFFTDNFEITGVLGAMTETSITATINMLGVAKEMVLSYSLSDKVLKMKGTLSLEEFGAIKAYNSIHKKCFDLHKGKTWDEVNVIIEVPILKTI